MHYLSFIGDPFIEALGRSLLHSCWQALIVFACLRLVLLALPQASPRARYNLSFAALIIIFGWFVLTQTRQLHWFSLAISNDTIPWYPLVNDSPSRPGYLTILDRYLPVLVTAYFAGFAWFTVKLVCNYIAVHRIKAAGLPATDQGWEGRISRLAARLHINRLPKIAISESVDIPMMIGWIKPLILLPVAVVNKLSAEQLEAILLHELAHIRRNDYLFNILQSFVETVLFFNPFVWWISARIREERENCCDEIVLLQDVSPVQYARALLTLEESRLRLYPIAMGAVNKKFVLLHRIKKITKMPDKNTDYRPGLIALLIISLAVISVAWLAPSGNGLLKKDDLPAVQKAGISFLFLPGDDSLPDHDPVKKRSAAVPTLPLPPSPPLPPPVAIASPAVQPPAPFPPLPAIDSVPRLDTIHFTGHFRMDSSFRYKMYKMDTIAFHQVFNSAEWKKQQQLIRENAAAMQKFTQSKAWKAVQETIKKNNKALEKYFKSPEWKAQQKAIQRSSAAIQQYFNSAEWKKQQAQQSALAFQQYFNSPEWKQRQDNIRHSADSIKAYFNSPEWRQRQEQLKQEMDKVKQEQQKILQEYRRQWEKHIADSTLQK